MRAPRVDWSKVEGVLSKSARWFFSGQDVQGIINQIGGALYHMGIGLVPSGPSRWQGEGPAGSYGMKPKLWVSVMPDQGGFWIDIRLWADVDVGFLVLFGAMWFVCFPAALLLLLLGNSSWSARSNELMMAMQQPVAHLQSTPNWGHPPMGR